MTRKLPALTPDNRAFWQGGEHGQLMIHHCDACARWFHPPAPVCPRCSSRAVEPRAVSGKGRVHSFTVNRQVWDPAVRDPYVVAAIELVEQPGLQFISNVIDCAPEAVHIGMSVEVTFLEQEDVWIPLFAPEAG